MINLLKNDLQITLTSQWKKFIPIVLLAILGCLQLFLKEKDMNIIPGFMDYLQFFIEGIEPFKIIDPNTIFKIPAIWLCLHLYIFYLIADYPIQDMKMIGKETLVKVGNRRVWWASRCLTTVMIVIASYIILNLTIILFTLSTRGELLQSIGESSLDMIVTILVLPLLMTCCVGLFQLSISLRYGSLLSFLSIVVVLVMSAYFMHPLLFGNYLMLLRNQILLADGVLTRDGFILAGTIGMFGYGIGYWTIRKLNIY